MPRNTVTISVFLASPSDVSRERDLMTQVVGEWNNIGGRNKGIYFDVLRWEKSVSSGFGEDGQDVINSQIDDFDVLIAIFWSRIGSPTLREESESIEEYKRALNRRKAGDDIELAFYFKNAPIDRNLIDPNQIAALNEFQNDLKSEGAFYKEFVNDDGLRYELNLLLDRLSRRFSSTSLKSSSKEINNENKPLSYHNSTDSDTIIETFNSSSFEDVSGEAGLIDVTEAIQSHTVAGSQFLDKMNQHLVFLGEEASEIAEIFAIAGRLGPVNPVDIKPQINRISLSMDTFSDFLEKGVPGFSEDNSRILSGLVNLIDIAQDFDPKDREIIELRSVILVLINTMSDSMMSLRGLADTTNGLQRMSMKFNKSKRRLSNAIGSLINVLNDTLSLLKEADLDIVNLIDRRHLH